MKRVFLKDGSVANLITKTDQGYVVDPIRIYEDYGSDEGEEYEQPSGVLQVVDKVYEKEPTPFLQQESKEWAEKIEEQSKEWMELKKQVGAAQMELNRLKTQQTDVSRYIINREQLRTAKTLVLWTKDSFVPMVMDGRNGYKFSINYDITQYGGEQRIWGYSISKEIGSWGSSQYFDEKIGIKTDLTDEEILAITHQRIKERATNGEGDFNQLIARTPDEWLTPEYIHLKNEIKEQEKRHQIDRAEKELAKAKLAYDALIAKK